MTGVLPGANDTVIFGYYAQYPSAASTPCVGLTGSFSDVQITDTYSGTVTFGGAVTMGALTLAGGAISQPTTGTDLTITSVFNWTGGTLNSSANLSTVHISGSVATITPGANIITTGSLLDLMSNGGTGATVTFNPGEVDFTNGAGISIGAMCVMNVAPTPSAEVYHKNVGHKDGFIDVKSNGELKIYGGNDFANQSLYDPEMPLVNQGKVSVTAGSKMRLTNPKDASGKLSAFNQTAGETRLENGSTIAVRDISNTNVLSAGFLSIRAGTFTAVEHPLLAGSVATIEGHMLVDSNPPTNPTISIATTLLVTGNVYWYIGTYSPTVNANGAASLWKANGTFYTKGASITLSPVLTGNAVVGQTWKVIQATLVDGTMPAAPTNWTFLAPNPATEWDVKWK